MATRKPKVQPTSVADMPRPKRLHAKVGESKYMGDEPVWPSYEEQAKMEYRDRKLAMSKAFNWYSSQCDRKQAEEWILTYLAVHPHRRDLHAKIKRFIAEEYIPTTAGWVARMVLSGWLPVPSALKFFIREMRKAEAHAGVHKEEVLEEVPTVAKPNIQDRLRENLANCLGEVEGKIDDFFLGGCKGDITVFDLFQNYKIMPGQIKEIVAAYQKNINEMYELLEGKDSQLIEGYKHLGKRQVKATIAMYESIQAAANSYGQAKKINRAPRKKKAVSPEKVVSKLKFLKKFDELKLESVEPVKILGASEAWFYNTKTRKIVRYVADMYQKTLNVKNSMILGFDSTESKQKTLRKPADQLKAFNALGKPGVKKWIDGIRSVETKPNGRINDQMVILRVFK